MRFLFSIYIVLAWLQAVQAQPGSTKKTGCLSGGCKYGKGVYRYENGDWYSGGFKDGLRFGDGTLVRADGDSILGYFRMDTLRGYVHYYHKNGQVYKGNINNQGDREGQGDLLNTDTTRYVGEWQKNMPNGTGVKYKKDGTIERGRFLNGRLVEEVLYRYPLDSLGDGEFCSAYRDLIKTMKNRFQPMRGYSFEGDKGKEWMPVKVLPGAVKAYIYDVDTVSSQAYFELLRNGTQAQAQEAYESVRRKVKICKPFDYNITQDESFTSDDNLILMTTGIKRSKTSTAPNFTTELKAVKNSDMTYTVTMRFIAYDNK